MEKQEEYKTDTATGFSPSKHDVRQQAEDRKDATDDAYDIKNKTGYMLILNFEFEGNDSRKGTGHDVRELKSYFGDHLGFVVNDPRENRLSDLTKEEVDSCLASARNHLKENSSEYYCFFCVILSHGNEKGILTATPNAEISTEQLRCFFANSKMPQFEGKPKVFVIQACRGCKVQTCSSVQTDGPRESNDDFIRMPEDADVLIASSTTPRKPSGSEIKADSIKLRWDSSSEFSPTDYYQIRYKDVDSSGKWRFYPKEFTVSSAVLTDLKSNTTFVFQVRVVHDEIEGPYGPQSDEIMTTHSPATRMVQFSTIIKKGNPSPSLLALPITENRNARNQTAKTKQYNIGSPPITTINERTIMLVGATGTGKSTLVNGIVNYVLGVNWDDPFRFTVISPEEEEFARQENQALSQTEWITCYSINPEQGSRLGYRLNIIDTPGFGDTRGLQRDHQIVNQIRELFLDKGYKGVVCIDAICFLIKAPDARLTATQTYIFHAIMALFGQDVENNICSLITFADGVDPPVLAALQESKLPFGRHFTFNNSGLFSKNVHLDSSSLSPMFWDMGSKSFRALFDHVETMQTKSLQLTKEVLEERMQLEITIQNVQPQVDAVLTKLGEIKSELQIFEQYKTEIEANKNFEYEITEIQQVKTEIQKGLHVTNCLYCNFTCHKRCAFANDQDKAHCIAMDRDGNCRECVYKCIWSQHHNTPYIFDYVTVTKKKTYNDKLEKYQKAKGDKMTREKVIERMTEELNELEDGMEFLMEKVKECNERLKEIALRPNSLSMVQHIDLMIECEKMENKEGVMARIAMLQEFRKKAEIQSHAESFSKEVGLTRSTVLKTNIKAQKRTFSIGKYISNLT